MNEKIAVITGASRGIGKAVAEYLADKEYANLKLDLEKQYKYDREKYTDEKTAFVNHILDLAKEEIKP